MATPVYETMVPGPNDTEHVLLVKAGYWAQKYSEDNGFTPDTAFFAEGMTPGHGDSRQRLLAKLAYWLHSLS